MQARTLTHLSNLPLTYRRNPKSIWKKKHDVVIYDATKDLVGVNAETKGERELYRQTLGDVVFGDALYFDDGNVFTLAPIRTIAPDVLNCDDIDGVTRVRLLEVVRVIPGEVSWIDRKSSSDLYKALGMRWQETLQRGRITTVKFGFCGGANGRRNGEGRARGAGFFFRARNDGGRRWTATKATRFIESLDVLTGSLAGEGSSLLRTRNSFSKALWGRAFRSAFCLWRVAAANRL